MRHPKVMQSLIFNYSLKVNIDGPTRPQIVPKLLVQVSVREIHNILVGGPDGGGLKEAIYEENNIIIVYYTLSSLFPPQLLKLQKNTRSCVVVNVVYLPKLYIHHYYHDVIGI